MNKLNMYHYGLFCRTFEGKVSTVNEFVGFLETWFYIRIDKGVFGEKESYRDFMNDNYTKPFEMPKREKRFALRFDDAFIKIDYEILEGVHGVVYLKINEIKVMEV